MYLIYIPPTSHILPFFLDDFRLYFYFGVLLLLYILSGSIHVLVCFSNLGIGSVLTMTVNFSFNDMEEDIRVSYTFRWTVRRALANRRRLRYWRTCRDSTLEWLVGS